MFGFQEIQSFDLSFSLVKYSVAYSSNMVLGFAEIEPLGSVGFTYVTPHVSKPVGDLGLFVRIS